MPRLTVESIKRRRPTDKRQVLPDAATRGLYLIVEPSGTKTFRLRYKASGKEHVYTLGQFGDAHEPGRITVEAARALAANWQARIRVGDYPHAVLARERAERRDAPTFADLAEQFRAKYLEQHTRRAGARMVTFNKHVLPELGAMKLRDIRRRDLNAVLDDVTAKGHAVAAYGLARLLGQMFRFAVDEELLEASPAERLRKGKPAGIRDRVLSDDELRALWTALDVGDLPMSAAIRIALRLLLLTGARAGELCAARWSELRLHGDMPLWTIPRTATKANASHAIPLGPSAVRLFEQLHALTGDTPFVLPGGDRLMTARRTKPRKRVPSASLDPHAIAVALRRCFRDDKLPDVQPFTAHDLRRTMRTGLVRLGHSTELAERVIGHKPRSILVQTYDQYDRMPERRRVLLDWDAEVRRILAKRPKIATLTPRKVRS